MADVYLGVSDADPDLKVVLKFLRQDRPATPSEFQRFRREAREIRRLRHPHIVPLIGVAEARGAICIVTRYIEGAPLTTRVPGARPSRERPADPAASTRWLHEDTDPEEIRENLRILAEIADTLEFAHGKNVVHRDVKPNNIIVRKDGHPFLLDFGIAKRIDSESRLTSTGTVMGTYPYMSPEQITGDTKHLDHRTDIYSLGVTAYELVEGRLPFDGENYEEMRRKILHAEPPPLARLRGTDRRSAEDVIFRALEKKPVHRYATAADLAQDLRFLADGKRPKASRMKRRVHRGMRDLIRRASQIAAVTIVSLSLVAIALVWVNRRTSRALLDVQVDNLLGSGHAALNRAEYDDALRLYREAESKDPDGYLPHLCIAMAHGRYGLWDEMEVALRHAEEKGFEPDPAKLRRPEDDLGYGLYLVSQGDERAEEHLRRAVERDRSLRSAYFPLVEVIRSRDPDEVIDALRLFRDGLNYDDPYGRIFDGFFQELEGQLSKALATFESVREMDVKAPIHLDRHLGRLYLKLNRLDDALETLRRAVDSNPEDGASWVNLASVHREMATAAGHRGDAAAMEEHISLAEDRVREGLELAPHMLEGHKIAAWTAMTRKDWEAFRATVATMEELDPEDRDVRNARAELCYRDGQGSRIEGDDSKARSALERCLELRPDHVHARISLSELQERAGESAAAFESLNEARTLVDQGTGTKLGAEERKKYWIHLLRLAMFLDRSETATRALEALRSEYDRAPKESWAEDRARLNALNLARMLALADETSGLRDCDFVRKLLDRYRLLDLEGLNPAIDEALADIVARCP
jgi:serine/threonine protein kinase/Tfp pilus assembly protein PilF